MVAEQQLPQEESLAVLRERFPKAAPEELLRFCRARPNSAEEAANMYEDHVQWRKGPGSTQRLEEAAEAVAPGWIGLGGQARDGTPIVMIQGARYDPGVEAESYVLAGAKALEDARSPADEGKVTVLIDTRPGEGWHNVPAHQMLPLFKLLSATLPGNYPERAHRIIVYPMPFLVKGIWSMVKPLLDPVTREKFVILSGPAGIGSPCPAELAEYVSPDQLPEAVRHTHEALAQN
jgi:hypothetical protein|mmetsp:Transcript_29668/g.64990  ORF Transcript_29668/g.64990 Transcript_29668/m.64990 type:complete len:234 (-) Transcript_29668:197-898(-)